MTDHHKQHRSQSYTPDGLPIPCKTDPSALPMQQPKRPTAKHKFKGHKKTIWSFVFLHDNVHIVSSSEDGTMRKWNYDTGLLVGEPWKGKGGLILALALSPDGKTIACGRKDGDVQRWGMDGKMMEDVWMGHSNCVRSLSWSPSGNHIASGSYDGTILIRRAQDGNVEVNPIQTKQRRVYSLAYSPSGDRIASAGDNTICIWDSNTGGLLVGPIKDLGGWVTSVVWSFDSSKLYSASDEFARVFDTISGALLHRFQHDNVLYSVALSPEHNLLACVGVFGVAQLWDTESHQSLSRKLRKKKGKNFHCVSFSPDGRYMACGGNDKKITLWMVQDIAPQLTSKLQGAALQETPSDSSPSSDITPQLEARTSMTKLQLEVATTQEIRPESPSSPYLEVSTLTFSVLPLLKGPSQLNATITTEGRDDPYKNFFEVHTACFVMQCALPNNFHS